MQTTTTNPAPFTRVRAPADMLPRILERRADRIGVLEKSAELLAKRIALMLDSGVTDGWATRTIAAFKVALSAIEGAIERVRDVGPELEALTRAQAAVDTARQAVNDASDSAALVLARADLEIARRAEILADDAVRAAIDSDPIPREDALCPWFSGKNSYSSTAAKALADACVSDAGEYKTLGLHSQVKDICGSLVASTDAKTVYWVAADLVVQLGKSGLPLTFAAVADTFARLERKGISL